MIGVIFQMVDGPMVFSGKDRPCDDGFVVVTTMWLFCLVNGNHNHYIRKIFRTIRFNKLACAMLNIFFLNHFLQVLYRFVSLCVTQRLEQICRLAPLELAANLINTSFRCCWGKKSRWSQMKCATDCFDSCLFSVSNWVITPVGCNAPAEMPNKK